MDKYFSSSSIELYNENCINVLNNLPEKSVNMIFADPPYFLSNGGISCKSGKVVSVNKAKWDVSKGFENDFEFNKSWIEACKRVLKDDGTIWISGTMHNIYQVGFALQNLNYKILNEISWFKPNAPPNLSCRYFTHSHETLIWAKKSEKSVHKFNYKETKDWEDRLSESGKQMRSVWVIPLTPPSEKKHGKHPTQKPIELLKRIIVASTKENDVILDPFNGSGTTGVVAKMLNRNYIGIDIDKNYLDLTLKRLNKED